MASPGAALLELSDIANSISGDFHTMHLNFKGEDFDAMHKEVLKDYYGQAAEDYDSWAEAACMFGEYAENTNESASRIGYASYDGGSPVDRNAAIIRTAAVLEMYCGKLLEVFNALSLANDCYKSCGIANDVQGRLAYWSKERDYFNDRRFEA